MTYVALANVTLSSNASSVTFSSIPTTGFRDLVLIYEGQVSQTMDFVHRFNGDTLSTNYFRSYAFGNGSSPAAATNENVNYFWYGSSGSRGMNTLDIFDYSATDKHKSVLARFRQAATGASMVSGRWANTAAINSINISTTLGVMLAGTTVALYGIRS